MISELVSLPADLDALGARDQGGVDLVDGGRRLGGGCVSGLQVSGETGSSIAGRKVVDSRLLLPNRGGKC